MGWVEKRFQGNTSSIQRASVINNFLRSRPQHYSIHLKSSSNNHVIPIPTTVHALPPEPPTTPCRMQYTYRGLPFVYRPSNDLFSGLVGKSTVHRITIGSFIHSFISYVYNYNMADWRTTRRRRRNNDDTTSIRSGRGANITTTTTDRILSLTAPRSLIYGVFNVAYCVCSVYGGFGKYVLPVLDYTVFVHFD